MSAIIQLPKGQDPRKHAQGQPVPVSTAMDPCVEMGLVQAGAEITLAILRNTPDPDVHAVAKATLVKVLDHIPAILSKHKPMWVMPKGL